ncbi:hypothetical protein [Sphingosinicella sp. BN140058]|uniref:hypothetical protein n=1 Tax=Sphingosinicella sp. BN140058 TaxID=1892855 RepID=UPI001012EFCB|nr:hypothetical protein [Sphingosinicella sp. BN140058]QAY78818.1 hypothetical protein ETR14_21480 [Sphingosinicella sp. BN140058]
MSDYDRPPGQAPDPPPIHDHVTERTTIVTTETGHRSSGGWIVAILLVVALLAILFLVFGDRFGRAAEDVGVNVNIDAPKVEIPDTVKIEVPEKVEVDLPDAGKDNGNSAK